MNKKIYLILHNIRSAENVGAIFRTADATGVSHIYLSGYTPRPVDQFGRVSRKVAKTALGAEKIIAWDYVKNVTVLIKKLKESKKAVIAIEQDKQSIDYKKFKLTTASAFVFGNEVTGLSKSILSKCDQIVEIPMKGQKESLNVSVAVGVILFHLF